MPRKIVNNVLIVVLVLLVGFYGFESLGQNKKDELYSKRDKILKDIQYTTKLLNSTTEKKGKTLQRIRLLDKKIAQRKSLINLYSEEIGNLNLQITEKEDKIEKLSSELENQKRLYAGFIYYAYKNYNKYTSSVYLLASETLNQFYLRKKYLEQLGEARRKKVNLILSIKKTIKYELKELVLNKKLKTESLEALNDEQKKYSTEKKSREIKVKELVNEEKNFRDQIKQKHKIEEEIARRIEELIEEEARKNSFAKLTPEQQLISDHFENNKGRLPWPTRQGLITEKFGKHPHPIIPNVEIFNSGIDISTIPSEKVRAIFDGTVSKIFAIKGANYTVIVRHGAYYSVYHNLIDIQVNVGDNINTKDIIGKVSKINNDGSYVVHLEIWKGLEKLNPEEWISN